MDLQVIINNENTSIVDVREPFEFKMGHAVGAINIPLGTIPYRVAEFKELSKPIIVYCRSGMRSGQAMGLLRTQGIEKVYNGGSLSDMEQYQKQASLF